MITLHVSNDVELRLDGLTDANGTSINDATVTARVLSLPGKVPVTSPDPIPLAPLGADGNYSATLDDQTPLVEGRRYLIKIRAEKGGTVAEWEEIAIAKKRRF